MTLPRKVVGILGVVHVLFVTYTLLAVDFFLAVKAGSNSFLIGAFKSYGILLFLVPMVWTVSSAYYLSKPEPPPFAAPIAFWSWVAITVLLLALDVLLTAHAIGPSAPLKV